MGVLDLVLQEPLTAVLAKTKPDIGKKSFYCYSSLYVQPISVLLNQRARSYLNGLALGDHCTKALFVRFRIELQVLKSYLDRRLSS